MLNWKQQGPAYTASLVLEGGAAGSLVVIAAASNPHGVALITKDAEGNPVTEYLPAALARLRPGDIIEALAMQERAFGGRGWPAPLGA